MLTLATTINVDNGMFGLLFDLPESQTFRVATRRLYDGRICLLSLILNEPKRECMLIDFGHIYLQLRLFVDAANFISYASRNTILS